MKKIFTLVAMATMALAANAQTESAFIDTENEFTATDATAISGGTQLCESKSIVMSQAWDDTYKKVAMSGESDLVNAVVINGVEYAMPAGIQCQVNPSPNNLTAGGQTAGAVFKFDVKQDGVLYVFGKMTYNKNYYVWEGDVANGAGMPVAYTFAAGMVADGQGDATVTYTLPGDELNYYSIGDGYDDGAKYLSAAQCVEKYAGGNYEVLTHWTKGNALGVIAFPVYAEAEEYYVNACGSKITSNGFVFIPNADKVASIEFKKGETTGINNVVANSAAKTPAVKVLKNGQITIGNVNIAGQRVK